MKNTTKLASAALVAALGMVTVIPQAVKAEESSLAGGGKVQFTSTTTSSTTPTNPSGGSNGSGSGELTDSSGGTTTDVGAFGVDYVTNLDFASHSIVSGAANSQTYWANTWVANEGNTKNSNFISFKDTRQTLDHTYEISGKITKQFSTEISGTNIQLNGATITYNNPHLVPANGTEASLTPSQGLASSAVIDSEKSTPVLTNVNAEEAATYTTGYGEYSLLWGTYDADEEKDTSSKSVQLTVPRGTTNAVIQEGTYNAEITWTMSDTPIPTTPAG